MRYKPSPSLIVSIIAVVIASAGSATAATLVTSKQIKNGTVTSADIRNGTIGKRDLKAGAVGSRQLQPGAIEKAAIAPRTVQELQATVATTRVSKSEPIVYGDNGVWGPNNVEIACPEGQIALGGGGGFVEVPHEGKVGSNKPLIDAGGVARGWRVAGSPVTTENKTLEVYAICSL